MEIDTQYTVFVGGIEVNDFSLHLSDAKRVCQYYLKQGYDDVQIVETETGRDYVCTRVD